MRRSREPFLWALFSGGGMMAALILPALIFALWVAPNLGWTEVHTHAGLRDLTGNLLLRLVLFGFITLSLFHWAHRFRYTLYDGLQLYHLNVLIATITYGIASILALVAAYVVWIA